MTKPVFFMLAGALLASGWWTLINFELARELYVFISLATVGGTLAALIMVGIETTENWDE